MISKFNLKTVLTIKNVEKDNNPVHALLVFYENRKTTFFKVSGLFIYCIIYKYFCVYYMCLQEVQLYLTHKVLENTTFNYISGISIPKLILKIVSCNGFVNYKSKTGIFSCYRKLVSCFLSKIICDY